MDRLWEKYPHCLVDGSYGAAGLPDGQMGNSEVGHVNLGAGRIVYQDFTRISKAISDRHDFSSNTILCDALKKAKAAKGAVHIMGLLSAARCSQPRRPSGRNDEKWRLSKAQKTFTCMLS